MKMESKTLTFKIHTQWSDLEANPDFMKFFEFWYKSNKQHYKHVKHAFNSMCKHFKHIEIDRCTISKKCIIWKFISYKNKTWIYQQKGTTKYVHIA